jgi:hypothetical protein
MSPIDMGPPPAHLHSAAIGHNSRAADIQRAAEELKARADYLNAFITHGTGYKWRLLHAANSSEMSDAAFRLLFTFTAYSKEDGSSIFPSHKTVAAVIHRSERSTVRTTKELEDAGWLISKRQRRGSAIRTAAIPDAVSKAIIYEVLEATSLACLNDHLEVPDLTVPKLNPAQEPPDLAFQGNQEPPNCASRTAKLGVLTSINQSSIIPGASTRESGSAFKTIQPDEKDLATNLAEADFIAYNQLFNSWGKKPGDITPTIPHKRLFTDANLLGTLRGQSHRDRKLAISAIRSTVVSMQSRTILTRPDRVVYGAGGFGAYFQKELVGMLDRLEKPRAGEPPQRVRPANSNFGFGGNYVGVTL